MAVTINKKPVLSKPTLVMGIDPSTKMGWVLYDLKTGHLLWGTLKFPPQKGMDRLKKLAVEVFSLVNQHKPDMVVIEEYRHGGKFNNTTQTEMNAITRLNAARACSSVVPVAITSLKKYVTGNGGAKKDLMMKEVYKRWGFEGTDDECDAYGLMMFGQSILGNYDDLPKANMASVETWWKENDGKYYLPLGFTGK